MRNVTVQLFIVSMLATLSSCSRKADVNPPHSPVLDLDENALCGLRLGERHSDLTPEDLVGRGLAVKRSEEDRGQGYSDPGNSVEIACSDTVDWFLVRWRDPHFGWEAGVKLPHVPFRGRVIHDGEDIELSEETTESEFRQRFGEPYWRDADEDEVLLFYEPGKFEWQVEFSPEGTLRSIIVTTAPLLADPQQRQAYGVDKPWPE